MKNRAITTACLVLATACTCGFMAFGQPSGPSILGSTIPSTLLKIQVENIVEYVGDVADPLKYGLIPTATPSINPKGIPELVEFGDIVAVNGQPARGTMIDYGIAFGASPSPLPGFAIADITRAAQRYYVFEIQQGDGTPVGSLILLGLGAGAPPPGAPHAQTGSNFAIVGGTGAFLGARGQAGGYTADRSAPRRHASFAEDPAIRRDVPGAGIANWLFHIIPITVPQIVATVEGAAVSDLKDFPNGNAKQTAVAGELLTLLVTGLGATVPGVDPGAAFPESPASVVNSPLSIMVNGQAAEVLSGVGFPGTSDGYQVTIRVPDTPAGAATVVVSSAWINSQPFTITVR